jgi:ferredoxin
MPAPPADAAAPAPSALAVTSAPADAALAPIPSADAATPATPAVAAAAAPSAQAEVQFSKSGKTGPLAPDQPVLEAAEAIGVAIDYSCRVGICGICIVPLLKGSVTMEVEEGLRPEDKARGIILACQAKSPANLVVDA